MSNRQRYKGNAAEKQYELTTNFSSGVNTKLEDSLITDKFARIVDNFDIQSGGELSKRPGFVPIDIAPRLKEILSVVDDTTVSKTEWVSVVQFDDKVLFVNKTLSKCLAAEKLASGELMLFEHQPDFITNGTATDIIGASLVAGNIVFFRSNSTGNFAIKKDLTTNVTIPSGSILLGQKQVTWSHSHHNLSLEREGEFKAATQVGNTPGEYIVGYKFRIMKDRPFGASRIGVGRFIGVYRFDGNLNTISMPNIVSETTITDGIKNDIDILAEPSFIDRFDNATYFTNQYNYLYKFDPVALTVTQVQGAIPRTVGNSSKIIPRVVGAINADAGMLFITDEVKNWRIIDDVTDFESTRYNLEDHRHVNNISADEFKQKIKDVEIKESFTFNIENQNIIVLLTDTGDVYNVIMENGHVVNVTHKALKAKDIIIETYAEKPIIYFFEEDANKIKTTKLYNWIGNNWYENFTTTANDLTESLAISVGETSQFNTVGTNTYADFKQLWEGSSANTKHELVTSMSEFTAPIPRSLFAKAGYDFSALTKQSFGTFSTTSGLSQADAEKRVLEGHTTYSVIRGTLSNQVSEHVQPGWTKLGEAIIDNDTGHVLFFTAVKEFYSVFDKEWDKLKKLSKVFTMEAKWTKSNTFSAEQVSIYTPDSNSFKLLSYNLLKVKSNFDLSSQSSIDTSQVQVDQVSEVVDLSSILLVNGYYEEIGNTYTYKTSLELPASENRGEYRIGFIVMSEEEWANKNQRAGTIQDYIKEFVAPALKGRVAGSSDTFQFTPRTNNIYKMLAFATKLSDADIASKTNLDGIYAADKVITPVQNTGVKLSSKEVIDNFFKTTDSIVFNNQLFFYGGSSTFFVSDVNNFTYMPMLNNRSIPTDSPIVSMVVYYDSLIIATDRQQFVLKGKTPQDFVITELNSDIGVIATKSVRNNQNNVTQLTRDGVYNVKTLWNNQDRLNVEKIDGNIDREITIDKAASAVTFRNRYYICSPKDKSIWIYYNDFKAWIKYSSELFDLNNMFVIDNELYLVSNKSFGIFKISQPDEALLSGTSEDQINYYEEKYTDKDMNGEELVIKSTYKSIEVSYGEPNHDKKFKKLQVRLADTITDTHLEMTIWVDSTNVLKPENDEVYKDPTTGSWTHRKVVNEKAIIRNVSLSKFNNLGKAQFNPLMNKQQSKFVSDTDQLHEVTVAANGRQMQYQVVHMEQTPVNIKSFGTILKVKKPNPRKVSR